MQLIILDQLLPTLLCGARLLARWRSLLARAASLFIAACIGMMAISAPAAASNASAEALERSVKAAYLYKFLAYVEWPPPAFPQTDSPYVIGIMGDDPMADELTRISAGRKVNNRSVTIRRLKYGDALTGLHLLFIGQGESQRQAQILKQVQQRPVLTVTDNGDAGLNGGVINFHMVDARIRFDVFLASAERNELKLSSRLLSVAYTVHPGSQS